MKKSNKLLNGFMAFVIISASLAVALFLNVPGQIKKYCKESFKPVQNNEQPKDETVDWNVYRNEEYGFEFEYKSDWQLKQQDNYIELKPIINNKPEEISISVNIITNRPKDYTLAGWLLQNGNNNASCDFVKKVDKIEWCGVNSERFEAVRTDDYGTTKDNTDYDIQFRVAYGRQEMDYYISDKELSSEINNLDQVLSTFEFIEKDETADWNIYKNEEYGFQVKYPQDWVNKEYDNEIYFGTIESKSGGYIWGISVQQPNELEKLISQTGNQFDDRKETRESVTINKNISGTLVTVTTNKHVDWISKEIYFEKDGKLFVIGNGSIVDDRFKAFFNSFEFINKDETADWITYQNKDYGISFQYPSSWLLEKDSADKNIFGMSFAIKNINTRLSVIGVTNNYVDEGPPGWFGYCAVSYKNVDQFCEKGCTRINDKTATRRGRENHGDAGYSFLTYTNTSKNFPSICWELDLSSILSKIAIQKGIKYYEVKNEDVEAYIKENNEDEDLKDIIQKFEEFSRSIKSF